MNLMNIQLTERPERERVQRFEKENNYNSYT